MSVPSHTQSALLTVRGGMKQMKLYKQWHPPSEHSELASTAMSKNPGVPIVGVNVSMCVCWSESERAVSVLEPHSDLLTHLRENHSTKKKNRYIILCPLTI